MENQEIILKVQNDLAHLSVVRDQARSAATLKAYKSDYRNYCAYCLENYIEPEPVQPGALALYLVELSQRGMKVTSIARHATAIRVLAIRSGSLDPFDSSVRDVLLGLRRGQAGQYTRRQAKPLSIADLRAVIGRIDLSVAGKRDRAVLLIGWFGALRRSEIASLDRNDIDLSADGLRIRIRRSKTDQESQGYEIGIPRLADDVLDACDAWIRWLEVLDRINPDGQAVFCKLGNSVMWQFTIAACCGRPRGAELPRLSARSVCEVLRRRLRAARLSAVGYSGHSLRAGFATEAAACGVPEWAIQRHTRHKSTTSLRSYIRAGQLFGDNENAVKLMLGIKTPSANSR